MTTNTEFQNFALSQLSVLIERHLLCELDLLDKIEAASSEITSILAESGFVGARPGQPDTPAPSSQDLEAEATQIKLKREKLLSSINRDRPEDHLSIRQFIQLTDPSTKNRLENIRQSIITKLNDIHVTMLGNQAVFFYSFDFYKKMVCGLMQCDLDENQYRPNGQTTGVKPGNLYRKAC